ncbi:hypothetical protein [Paenibacillus whitsoniae]|uniref:Uncharacterized protein n=1 Tax=Paenibacillus whitsoniae TaxID=2496558 RepID=A0A3S0A304_9BACL|nr:hypothetical protein [Paenibacillus whitsoniae]RTE08331.1 hypothetical protein EJQ19_18070 [Paenibacillus whitsoniae]
MMRLKRKSILVSLSLSTLVASGTAYAYTGAGETLQQWMKLQVQLQQQAIEGQLREEMNTARSALSDTEMASLASVGEQLDKESAAAAEQAARQINQARSHYTDEFDRAAAELSKSSQEAFDAYVASATGRMQTELERTVTQTIQGFEPIN